MKDHNIDPAVVGIMRRLFARAEVLPPSARPAFWALVDATCLTWLKAKKPPVA